MSGEKSLQVIVEYYSTLQRQLQNLDLRGNSLTEDNAELLYNSFPSIQLLNEIKIYQYKRDVTITEMDCNNLFLKLPEMKIIVSLLNNLKNKCHIHLLDVGNNLISAKALKVLAEGIRHVPLHELDISFNPCTLS